MSTNNKGWDLHFWQQTEERYPTRLNQTLQDAICTMKRGGIAFRKVWEDADGDRPVLFYQIPSEVPVEIVGRMISLPDMVKKMVVGLGEPLRYHNQIAALYPDNTVCGWSPSIEDCLSTDWCTVEPDIEIPITDPIEYAVAGDTVGSATPTA